MAWQSTASCAGTAFLKQRSSYMYAKIMGFVVRRPGSGCGSSASCLWAVYLASPSLSFLICEIDRIIPAFLFGKKNVL